MASLLVSLLTNECKNVILIMAHNPGLGGTFYWLNQISAAKYKTDVQMRAKNTGHCFFFNKLEATRK